MNDLQPTNPFFKTFSFCLSNQIISEQKELRSIIEAAKGSVVSFIAKVQYLPVISVYFESN